MVGSFRQRINAILSGLDYAERLRRGYRMCRRLCTYPRYIERFSCHLSEQEVQLAELSDQELAARVLHLAALYGMQLLDESKRFREELEPEKVRRWLWRERARCQQLGWDFDELCQDVVILALDKVPYVGRSEGEIIRWFQVTAHRLVSEYGRRWRPTAEAEFEREGVSYDPGLIASNVEEVDRLVQFIVRQDATDLEIIIRRCFIHQIIAEQKWDDIANAMGLGSPAVRQRYARIVKRYCEIRPS